MQYLFQAVVVAVSAAGGWAVAQTAPQHGVSLPCRIETVYDADTATRVIVEIPVQVRYDKCWGLEMNQPGGKPAAASAKLAEGKRGTLYVPLRDANNLSDLFTFGRVVGELWVDGAKESESQRQVRLKHASTTKGGELGK